MKTSKTNTSFPWTHQNFKVITLAQVVVLPKRLYTKTTQEVTTDLGIINSIPRVLEGKARARPPGQWVSSVLGGRVGKGIQTSRTGTRTEIARTEPPSFPPFLLFSEKIALLAIFAMYFVVFVIFNQYLIIFSPYRSWNALEGCKMLLRGVGMICPPGKHHSENFQKSPKIEKCTQFFEMFGFGTLLIGRVC